MFLFLFFFFGVRFYIVCPLLVEDDSLMMHTSRSELQQIRRMGVIWIWVKPSSKYRFECELKATSVMSLFVCISLYYPLNEQTEKKKTSTHDHGISILETLSLLFTSLLLRFFRSSHTNTLTPETCVIYNKGDLLLNIMHIHWESDRDNTDTHTHTERKIANANNNMKWDKR